MTKKIKNICVVPVFLAILFLPLVFKEFSPLEYPSNNKTYISYKKIEIQKTFSCTIKSFYEYQYMTKIKVVTFGDSITYGSGISNETLKWTEILKNRFNLDLINSGVPGDDSSKGLKRIEKDVLKYKPDYVIINFGMNDFYFEKENKPHIPLCEFENNIRTMIKKVKSINSIAILVAPNKIIDDKPGNPSNDEPPLYRYINHPTEYYDDVQGMNNQLKKYCHTIKIIAEEENVVFIDMFSESEKYDLYKFVISDNIKDGVHPSEFGAKIYAETIGTALEKLINLRMYIDFFYKNLCIFSGF